MLYVVNLKDNSIHTVRKYIIENDGTESVWCDTWYGRHIIGRHCDFVSEKKVLKLKKFKEQNKK